MPLLNKKEIGKRLEMCRLVITDNATEYAKKAGVDQSQYAKIEKGTVKLSDNIWDKLENTYKLDKPFILLGINVPREVSNSWLLEPDPQASLIQLLKAKKELLLAAEKIQKRIDQSISVETDNLIDGSKENQIQKDNKSKRGKSDKE